MRILFDAGKHVIQDTGSYLGLGNHEVTVESMELVEKGENLQFKFVFRNQEGAFSHWAWVIHDNESAQAIGHDFLKKVCDYTGNNNARLSDEEKSWQVIYGKTLAIGIRKQTRKGVVQTYETNRGETRERFEIAFLARTTQDLPPYQADAPTIPSALEIMDRIGGRSQNHKPIDPKDDVPY